MYDDINKIENRFTATVGGKPISIRFLKDFVNDINDGKVNKNNYAKENKERISNNKEVWSRSSGKNIDIVKRLYRQAG